ncbi:MAG: hypothetical protein ACE5IL_11160 [Myxococcota bacterium]
MLPLLYGPEAAPAILENYETAPIPELHKLMFRWVERFTRCSWELGETDLEPLRAAGLTDADIVHWAQVASLQGWWTMSADGGGIPLEGNAVTGPVVGRPREFYEARPEGLTAADSDAAPRAPRASNGVAWVALDLESDGYLEAAGHAEGRYGFVPNLYKAVSLRPEVFPRHELALQLLEAPVTARLSARRKAMARACAASLNHGSYSLETVRTQLERAAPDEPDLFERIHAGDADAARDPADRAVLDFTRKVVRNTYKVTEKDAISFRESGLDDAAYIEVLNTAAIQTSFDRLTHALGVTLDGRPLLPGA